ncbi:hypothetical protein VPH35_008951 [Triticum aestivum]
MLPSSCATPSGSCSRGKRRELRERPRREAEVDDEPPCFTDGMKRRATKKWTRDHARRAHLQRRRRDRVAAGNANSLHSHQASFLTTRVAGKHNLNHPSRRDMRCRHGKRAEAPSARPHYHDRLRGRLSTIGPRAPRRAPGRHALGERNHRRGYYRRYIAIVSPSATTRHSPQRRSSSICSPPFPLSPIFCRKRRSFM